MNRNLALSIFIAFIPLGVGLISIDFSKGSIPWYSATFLGIGTYGIVIFGFGDLFIKYDVKWGIPTEDIKVEFHFSLWKRLLFLGMSPKLGKIWAEVRYRYGDVPKWRHASIAYWGVKIGVEEPEARDKEIDVRGPSINNYINIWRDLHGRITAIDGNHTILPRQFDFNIRLVRIRDGKILYQYAGSYTDIR